MAKWTLLASLGMAAVFFLAGCITQELAKTPSVDEDAKGGPGIWAWNSTDAAGQIGVMVTLSSAEATDCNLLVNATGRDTMPSGPVMARIIDVPGSVPRVYIDSVGQIYPGSNGAVDQSLRVHAGAWSHETRTGREIIWSHSWESKFSLPAEQDALIWVAGKELAMSSGGPPALEIQIDCGAAVQASHAVGTTVHLFDEARMKGGAGVHAHALGDPSGAAIDDAYEADIEDTLGLLAVSDVGDLLTVRGSAGSVRVAYPGGEDSWTDAPGTMLVDPPTGDRIPHRVYYGGPGTYSLEASWVSPDGLGALRGAIVGISSMV